DAAMGTAAWSAAYRKFRADVGLADHPAPARHAAANLVARVGEAAGLTLYPDPSGQGVMDALVEALPEAINAAPALLPWLELVRHRETFDSADLAAVLGRLGAFRAAVPAPGDLRR